jgi:hypothetical protein
MSLRNPYTTKILPNETCPIPVATHARGPLTQCWPKRPDSLFTSIGAMA